MFCPQCGSANDDAARFCSSCGLDLGKYREQRNESGTQPAGQPQPGGQQPPAAPAQPYYQPPVQHVSVYQQPYQAPPYQGTGPYGVAPRIPSYMGWAIAVLILCFWPTGIVAVVHASRVNNRLALGDIAGAQESSRKAKTWCWITFIIAIVWVALVIIAAAVGWLGASGYYYNF